MSDNELRAKSLITQLLQDKDIHTWDSLLDYVRSIPYGRNTDRRDFKLVLTENKGTCSSKHALLKHIAHLNNIPNVKLILAIYKMTAINTPGISDHIISNGLAYLPEAHCYLMIDEYRVDLTSEHSDIGRISKDIISEQEISPDQVGNYKVDFHKAFILNWIEEQNIDMSFDEVWSIRERCISALSHNS